MPGSSGRQRVSAWDRAASCCNTTARIKLQKTSISGCPGSRTRGSGRWKSAGGLPLSTRALQRGLNQQEKGSFAEQLAQLDSWIRPENQSAEEAVRATPLPPVPAQGFLLGASVESALLAAKLNWHFVFAAHLNGDPDLLREVITTGVNTAPGR